MNFTMINSTHSRRIGSGESNENHYSHDLDHGLNHRILRDGKRGRRSANTASCDSSGQRLLYPAQLPTVRLAARIKIVFPCSEHKSVEFGLHPKCNFFRGTAQ